MQAAPDDTAPQYQFSLGARTRSKSSQGPGGPARSPHTRSACMPHACGMLAMQPAAAECSSRACVLRSRRIIGRVTVGTRARSPAPLALALSRARAPRPLSFQNCAGGRCKRPE